MHNQLEDERPSHSRMNGHFAGAGSLDGGTILFNRM